VQSAWATFWMEDLPGALARAREAIEGPLPRTYTQGRAIYSGRGNRPHFKPHAPGGGLFLKGAGGQACHEEPLEDQVEKYGGQAAQE